MAATNVVDYAKLKIHINHPTGGWSETYNMPTAAIATLKSKAVSLISNRADILAKNASIAYASLSMEPTPKGDVYLPRGYRYAPINLATEALITNVATCNDWEVGPLWRYDTGEGKYTNRVIRGLRDAQIADNAAAYQSSTMFSLAATDAWAGAVANTTTHADALKYFLSSVYHYTRHIKGFEAPALTGFTSRTYSEVQYRKISSHDGGQRYGAKAGRQRAFA